MTPAEIASRAVAASAHPICPSQGVLALLLGHALARGALPDGGGPLAGETAEQAAARLLQERGNATALMGVTPRPVVPPPLGVVRRRATAALARQRFLLVLHRWCAGWAGHGEGRRHKRQAAE
jgi:hypothetical protein